MTSWTVSPLSTEMITRFQSRGAFFPGFNFTITHRPGSRNAKPDFLSEFHSPPRWSHWSELPKGMNFIQVAVHPTSCMFHPTSINESSTGSIPLSWPAIPVRTGLSLFFNAPSGGRPWSKKPGSIFLHVYCVLKTNLSVHLQPASCTLLQPRNNLGLTSQWTSSLVCLPRRVKQSFSPS